jgi:hypothetical protein
MSFRLFPGGLSRRFRVVRQSFFPGKFFPADASWYEFCSGRVSHGLGSTVGLRQVHPSSLA